MIETIQKLTPVQREVLTAISKGQVMSSQWRTATLNRLIKDSLIVGHPMSVCDSTGIVVEVWDEYRVCNGVKEALQEIERLEDEKDERAVTPF